MYALVIATIFLRSISAEVVVSAENGHYQFIDPISMMQKMEMSEYPINNLEVGDLPEMTSDTDAVDADSTESVESDEDFRREEIQELEDDHKYATYREYRQEPECSRTGGMCVGREYCEPEHTNEGSCPTQDGAVCCQTYPTFEQRCRKFGGICRSSCPERITIARANNCPGSSVCCALVF